MTRKFVMLPEFDKNWANMGLNDNDNLSKSERNSIAKVIKALENALFGRKG